MTLTLRGGPINATEEELKTFEEGHNQYNRAALCIRKTPLVGVFSFSVANAANKTLNN